MRPDGRYIYDTFMFFQELDLLELRLMELDEVVDVFIIAESTMTHSGKPKPLHFDENRERFSKWLPRIKHLVLDLAPMTGGPWKRENFSRACLSQAAMCYYDPKVQLVGEEHPTSRPRDIIGVFDLDEIPRAEAYLNFDPGTGLSRVSMPLYYYYVNNLAIGEPWLGGVIFTHEFSYERWKMNGHWMRTLKPEQYGGPVPVIPDGGWHFSYMGGLDMVRSKLGAYAHTELAGKSRDPKALSELIEAGKDIAGRRRRYELVDLDNTFPKALLDNPDKFGHLIKAV